MAAIDCGTNSIRLLVTDLDPATDRQRDLDRRMRIVRLGQGVDRTRALAPEALARTFTACEEYAAACRGLGATRLRLCATSAARDASNAALFAAGVVERLGVEPEVITGAEEARLSATGALRSLPGAGAGGLPALVVDIGGGSTELVEASAGDGRYDVSSARSYDVGSVRLTERHLHRDPATTAEVAAAGRDVDAALDDAADMLSVPHTVVGVAGTVTTVAAHALRLAAYEPDRIHAARIGVGDVLSSCAAMLAATVAERAAMPFMHPGRVDVIGGGALVLERVLRRAALVDDVIVVSEHDILDGIAWSLVDP